MKLDGSKLYTEADVAGVDQWIGPAPGIGSIYRVQGRYYACTENWAPTDPSRSEWVDVTEFVTELW